MTDSNSRSDSASTDSIDDYQKSLSEQSKSGAGCTEMWNTVSENRSEENPSYSRRKLVSALAVSALGFGITGNSASAQETPSDFEPENDSEIDVLTVSDGDTRSQVRTQAFASSGFQRIYDEFESRGWQPRADSTIVTKTTSGNENIEQFTFALPFTTEQNGRDASIIWTSNGDFDTLGLSSVNNNSEIVFQRFSVENGVVRESRNSITTEELHEAVTSNTGGEYVALARFPLCTWNTSCIGTFALAGAALFSCCSTCASVIGAGVTGGSACICCVLSGIGTVSVECNVCE